MGEGVEGGIPLPHQGVFVFLEFKISDRVIVWGITFPQITKKVHDQRLHLHTFTE